MRKFTLFIASLFIAIGAMAQFTQNISDVTGTTNDGSTFEVVTEYPEGVTTAKTAESTGENCASTTIKRYTLEVGVANDGDATIEFLYKSGSHKLVILGVDLVNADGEVVGSDYHYGFTGGQKSNNTYTMQNLTAGNYTLRYFFCHKASDHEVGNQTATITVTGLTLEGYVAPLKYEELENGKIYTFVTERGWMGAAESHEYAISTGRASNNVTGDATNTYLQWTVYKSANTGNTYIYNIGKKMFLGEQSTTASASVPMSSTPAIVTFQNSDNSSYPIIFKTTDNANCVINHNTGLGYGLITWNGGWNNLTDGGNCHCATLVGDLDETTLNTIAAAVTTFETDNTEAVAALQAAIDAANAMNDYIGTGVGKYTYTGEGTFAAAVAEYQTYVDAIESTSTPTPAEVEAKTTELNTLVTSLTLNMPKAGSYIRIKSYATNQYLSSVNHTTKTTRAAFVADADASTIFYFNGTSLVSYASGNYLVNNSNFLGYNGVQETGATVEFQTANASLNLKGAYSIKLFGNNRWLYAQSAGYTDAGSGNGGNNYSYIIEEVTTLPVTITAAKYATLYAPVALEIPSSVTAYTASISGDYAILTEISGIIPAGTGVVLAGEANTYDFTITSTTATATSDLQGSAATTYNTEAGTYYALAIVDNVVGFYKDAFNNSRFQNNSHKAYLYVPTDEANAIASYSFSFDWGGTTGIENIEDAVEENATKAIYDITGRQIKAITVPGIYIINGKKTFVK